nr:hypothetical protein [Bacillota bacterium]
MVSPACASGMMEAGGRCSQPNLRPVVHMPQVTVYTVPNCLDCAAVKRLLEQAGIPYREVDISQIPGSREALALLSGVRSVPQVYVGDRFIGQVFEVRHLIHTGKLQEMLAKADAEEQTGPNGHPSGP